MSSVRSRAPRASSPLVRRVMQANVGRETSAERILRRALFAEGLRYRKDVRPVAALRCRADVVFRASKVCVFVDGCFWHGCSVHFTAPASNSAWWTEKIAENVARDRRQTAALVKSGWRVIRVWEHEVPRVQRAVDRIRRAVESRTP